MKKFLTALLLSALLLSSCGIPAVEDRSLYEHGLDVVAMLNEIAESEEYLSIYSANEDILSIVNSIAEGDHVTPETVYRLTLSEESVAALSGTDVLHSLSPELKAFLNGRVQASVINIANARGGSTALAATSICTAGKTFVSREITENMIYLYTFENAYPIAVSFTVGDGGSVSASGTYLIAEELNTDTPDAIKEFFSEMTLEVEVVPKD